jgi:xanthine dehydrogenase large subunit
MNALFPSEIQHYQQPLAVGTWRDPRRRASGGLRGPRRVPAAPAILTVQGRHRGRPIFTAVPLRLRRGDAAAAIAESPHHIEGEICALAARSISIWRRSALAWLDESGGVSVHSSTQHPSETQEVVARVLGIPRHQVTVECLRMGGAFGGKETQANPWAAIAALGAWKTKRPVRVRLPRALDMALTGKRHPFLARFEPGFDDEGSVQGLTVSLYLRRRLEPGPFRAGAVARSVPYRQLLFPAGRRSHWLVCRTQQNLADGLSWIRRSAGHARHRRYP